MKDTVDYDLLPRSVEKAMARYPYFGVFPKREEDSIVLHYNNHPLPVFPDDRTVTPGSAESGGHLISFGCKDNTIFIDCSGISYVGKMDWYGLERYVDDHHAYIGEKHTNYMLIIEVMTVGADFLLTFMQSGRGEKYLNAFMEELRSLRIPVNLVGEERYTLCNTELIL